MGAATMLSLSLLYRSDSKEALTVQVTQGCVEHLMEKHKRQSSLFGDGVQGLAKIWVDTSFFQSLFYGECSRPV
jgi:hypothetical protein